MSNPNAVISFKTDVLASSGTPSVVASGALTAAQMIPMMTATFDASRLAGAALIDFICVGAVTGVSASAGFTPYIKINGVQVFFHAANNAAAATALSRTISSTGTVRYAADGRVYVECRSLLGFDNNTSLQAAHTIVGDAAVSGAVVFEFGYTVSAAVTATVTRRPSVIRQMR